MQAAADVARVLYDRELVGSRQDMYALYIAFNIPRQTARVAREHKADALIPRRVRHRGEGAHHYNIRVSERLCNVFAHIKAVAASGIAVDNILAHK